MKVKKVEKRGRNKESALEEHFLISCEMSQITEVFLKSPHLNSTKVNREEYDQLTGGTNKRIMGNVGKLKEAMKAYNPWQNRCRFRHYFKVILTRADGTVGWKPSKRINKGKSQSFFAQLRKSQI